MLFPQTLDSGAQILHIEHEHVLYPAISSDPHAQAQYESAVATETNTKVSDREFFLSLVHLNLESVTNNVLLKK